MNQQESATISKEFATALIKARTSLKAPGKDGKNPHFKSQYMTLDNLTAAVMSAMEPHGLMVMQQPFSMSDDGGVCVGVETVVLHESGQTLSSGRDFFCRVVGGDAQKVGAAVTYLRRYGLGAMLGVVVEEDDDGHGASQRPQPRQSEQGKPKLASAPAKPAEAKPQPTGRRKLLSEICGELIQKGVSAGEIKEQIKMLCDGATDTTKLTDGDVEGLIEEFSRWLDKLAA